MTERIGQGTEHVPVRESGPLVQRPNSLEEIDTVSVIVSDVQRDEEVRLL